MPAQILHSLHGKMTLEKYCAKAEAEGSSKGLASAAFMRRLLEEPCHPFFCLGCQGPDLFYHNQRTRPVALAYGSLLHRRGYGNFIAAFLGNSLKTSETVVKPTHGAAVLAPTVVEPTQTAAYAIGFIMHAFLDRSLHPYIICRAGNSSGSTGEARGTARLHMFMERIIDVAMLEKLENLRVESWDQEKHLAAPAMEAVPVLLDALAQSLRQAYPERAGKDILLEKRLLNAFTDAGHFYRVTAPAVTSGKQFGTTDFFQADVKRGLALTAFLYPESFSRDIDFLNEGKNAWHHPCEPETLRTQSVRELFLEAVDSASHALEVIFLAEDEKPQAYAIAASVGNSGLSLIGPDGSTCIPRHFDQFPLADLLDEQYRTRISSVRSV